MAMYPRHHAMYQCYTLALSSCGPRKGAQSKCIRGALGFAFVQICEGRRMGGGVLGYYHNITNEINKKGDNGKKKYFDRLLGMLKAQKLVKILNTH